MSSSHGPDKSKSISSTILAGIKVRDENAWERLYGVWSPVVYNWCRSRRVTAEDANDIVQNVFLKASGGIGTFERGSFRAWIYRITMHAIADHFRQCGHVATAFGGSGSWINNVVAPDGRQQSQLDEQDSGNRDAPDSLQEPTPQNTRWVIVHRLLEVIRHDFEERTFQAFWRTAVDGRPTADVAEELGMPPTSVRTYKYRVLKRLRAELDGML